MLDDDKQLALRIKKSGGHTRVWWGGNLAALTLNRPPAEIVRGLARNFYTMSKGKPWRLLICLAFVIICCASAYAAIGLGMARLLYSPASRMALLWIIAGITHWIAISAAMALIYSYGRLPRLTALALPLTLGMSVAIFIRGLWMCVTGEITWHDVSYSTTAEKAS